MNLIKTLLPVLQIVLLVSICNGQSSSVSTAPDDFGFILRYGCAKRNVLDTVSGMYTKDMIFAPDTSVNLKLTSDEMNQIFLLMTEIGFFNLPDTVGADWEAWEKKYGKIPQTEFIVEGGNLDSLAAMSKRKPSEADRSPMVIVTFPKSYYQFEVITNGQVKKVYWIDGIEIADFEDVRANNMKRLTRLISSIIQNKPEYKALPPPKGGYL